ncbi:MAG: trans-aconitate 2-methyltransferase [Bauldia sp.]
MSDWSPKQYLRFANERTRAAVELLARVPLEAPRTVVDVGCGPGNSTELLAARFPDAAISAFDSSPAMIEAARARLPGVRFAVADVASWTPAADTDVVFSNAVLQWVPGHLDILERALGALRPGAVLAVQIPDNKSEPNHVLMRETAIGIGRGDVVRDAESLRDTVHSADVYYRRLAPLAVLDLWHTTYIHVLAGHDAIVEWLKGTGLRPYLDALGADTDAFLAGYRDRIAAAYPVHAGGEVLLPFPRLFMVAVRR